MASNAAVARNLSDILPSHGIVPGLEIQLADVFAEPERRSPPQD